ncbi:MAG: DUF805 domain-containing protein [Sutterellaceae bacterium]|nr:DUF805 domain-containing protein [Sutterellaceae bacterium]
MRDLENNTSIFSYKGKINRGPFILLNIVLSVVGALFSAVAESLPPDILLALIVLVGAVFIVVPSIFSFIKRCRTVGISPWWVLVTIIPLASFILFITLAIMKRKRGDEPVVYT